MRVVIIGSQGFVGSAFVRYLQQQPGIQVVEVTRTSYAQYQGVASDIVIEAACNSKKYWAEENPVTEFDASVNHRLKTLQDFPAAFHIHLSSVDVYSDLASPETTTEDSPIDLATASHYGFHKLLAEQLVQHYAPNWLIIRLAGMVGQGLRKNPVYDILQGQPLRIHPESQYQFMGTDQVAQLVWRLAEQGIRQEVLNLCGDGLISPAEIAQMSQRSLDLSLLKPDVKPRIVHINTCKIQQFFPLPSTQSAIAHFLETSG